MKKISFLSIVLLPLIVIGQNKVNKFILKGKIQNFAVPVNWVFIEYRTEGGVRIDSTQLKKGRYQFFGNIQEPVEARLTIKYKDAQSGNNRQIDYMQDVVPVFLEPGKIEAISINSFVNIQVKGSVTNNEFIILNRQVSPYGIKMNSLFEKINEYSKLKDKQSSQRIEGEIKTLEEEMNEKVYKEYIVKNPSSPLAMYAFLEYTRGEIELEKYEPLFNSLTGINKKYPSALEFMERLETEKKTRVGKFAMNFVQNDTLGLPITLFSLKGSYLLIEFWASWCKPCRVENPQLVKVFDKYKYKNFKIIGVSLDKPGQKEKWLKAIHDDRLEWINVSDLMFWDNAVVKQYGIKSIPQNILLDSEGKIIAKNLKTDELDLKLSEILGIKTQF